MNRYLLVILLVAGMTIAGGGAIWLRASLNESFARGHDAGAAELLVRYEADAARRRESSEAGLAESNRDVLKLELEREILQKKLDGLAAAAARAGNAGADCLDPDLVRALAGIGRAAPAIRPDP